MSDRDRWLEFRKLTPIVLRECRRLIRAGHYRTAWLSFRSFVRDLASSKETT